MLSSGISLRVFSGCAAQKGRHHPTGQSWVRVTQRFVAAGFPRGFAKILCIISLEGELEYTAFPKRLCVWDLAWGISTDRCIWEMYSWVGPGRALPGKMGEIEETVLLPDRLPCLALWIFSFLPLISLEFHDNFGERGSKGEKELCIEHLVYARQ